MRLREDKTAGFARHGFRTGFPMYVYQHGNACRERTGRAVSGGPAPLRAKTLFGDGFVEIDGVVGVGGASFGVEHRFGAREQRGD